MWFCSLHADDVNHSVASASHAAFSAATNSAAAAFSAASFAA